MLANPVVIHLYDPLIWPVCVVAMWAEIGTEVALLRRRGVGGDMSNALLLGNVVTWSAFLYGVDRLGDRVLPLAWTVTVLEVLVVVVEAAWIAWLLRRRARRRELPAFPLRVPFAVSLVGNLVSIVVSIVLPLLVALVIHWLTKR